MFNVKRIWNILTSVSTCLLSVISYVYICHISIKMKSFLRESPGDEELLPVDLASRDWQCVLGARSRLTTVRWAWPEPPLINRPANQKRHNNSPSITINSATFFKEFYFEPFGEFHIQKRTFGIYKLHFISHRLNKYVLFIMYFKYINIRHLLFCSSV